MIYQKIKNTMTSCSENSKYMYFAKGTKKNCLEKIMNIGKLIIYIFLKDGITKKSLLKNRKMFFQIFLFKNIHEYNNYAWKRKSKDVLFYKSCKHLKIKNVFFELLITSKLLQKS